ncbi:nicotinate-nucleotide adenylyltransferase [Scopulibacillus cellulosilyticus]|uniref:Probable nicotinate-nucleotide adenylyltransferase n=1 Tax=Scopulibacillus cellulosilyticus TaxID=2665665 RepID=A0ABW2PVV0_9BACL
MKKIGLIGGTFDPPHLGHLAIAEEAADACRLDEVWFLPSYIPPHKDRLVTDSDHRIAMVDRAIEDNPLFKLSLIEIKRKGRSYTYDTLYELKRRYPDDQFYFIIGADMVDDLPNWYKIDQLAKLTSFIGFKRPGYTFKKPEGVTIIPVEMPQIDISSSMIRKRINQHRSYRYFLCENVKKYIEEKGLYED